MPAMNNCPTEAEATFWPSGSRYDRAAGRDRVDHHNDRGRNEVAERAAGGDARRRRSGADSRCATIAGSMIEPMATTVAGEEPDTAENNAAAMDAGDAQAAMPNGRSWSVANAIMRRATPPWVRKLPARMKNGIAMISKLSMPVNSLSATASIGTDGEQEQEGQHGEAERDRDRHAGQHQRDQQDEDERACSSRASPGAGGTSMPSTWLSS